jgi:lysozyme
MRISNAGLKIIKRFEGCRYHAYRCPANLLTVGFGHVLTYNKQSDEGLNRTYTKSEVEDFLKNDLIRFERGVAMQLPVPLKQHEFDALVSFSFNVGLGTLQRSTIRQAILRGDKKLAAEKFLKYCYAAGKVLKGLQTRRIAEHNLFLGV